MAKKREIEEDLLSIAMGNFQKEREFLMAQIQALESRIASLEKENEAIATTAYMKGFDDGKEKGLAEVEEFRKAGNRKIKIWNGDQWYCDIIIDHRIYYGEGDTPLTAFRAARKEFEGGEQDGENQQEKTN